MSSLSPDGKSVAYIESWQETDDKLMVKNLSNGELLENIPGAAFCVYPIVFIGLLMEKI